MQEQDLLAKAEADTASVFPGAEKGNEDPVHQGSGNTTSVIRHFDVDLIITGRKSSQLDPGFLFVLNCLYRIDQQINQYLFNQGGVQLITKIRDSEE